MGKKIDRNRVHQKYGGYCGYCGEKIECSSMQIDHIIPKRNYIWHLKNNFRIPSFLTHLTDLDVNHFDNLMPSCRVCNNWKNTHDLEQFRIEISEQVARLNKYSANFRMAKRYGLVNEVSKPILFYFEHENNN